MTAVVERVDRLEEVLEDFVTNVGIEFNKLGTMVEDLVACGRWSIPAHRW
jgi:hypothetical protein